MKGIVQLRNYLNKLEDKGYYTPELVTKKDIKKYRLLCDRWSRLVEKERERRYMM